ncbi:MAG: biotin synthase BioB [Candidatus Scalindua sp.]|nr:biotin synthase BioB [Candidatus Scalindua sp.]
MIKFYLGAVEIMNAKIQKIADRAMRGKEISYDDAYFLMTLEENEVYDLFYWANRIRYHFFQNVISYCSIISIKQGGCTEDCTFCSQSSRYKTDISNFPLMKKEEFARAVKGGKKLKADCIGAVTSGYGLDGSKDFDTMCGYIAEMSKEEGVPIHTSVGVITEVMAEKLADSGVEMVNHNLETSESFYPTICTTHSYKERVETIKIAKQAGMAICSGGIFGVGEGVADRLDLAFALKALDVDAIPLNFLNPVSGTPLYLEKSLTPMKILQTIAVFRFIFPDKELKIAGGREANLRDLQSWIFYAGANSTMIGNYLTTKGKTPEDDFQMIKDLGLIVKSNNTADG